MNVSGSSVSEMIDFVTASGLGVISSPEDCQAQIDRLTAQSNGRFGAYLMFAHEWANPEATRRSYELFANDVMPKFQRQAQASVNAQQRAKSDSGRGAAAGIGGSLHEARRGTGRAPWPVVNRAMFSPSNLHDAGHDRSF